MYQRGCIFALCSLLLGCAQFVSVPRKPDAPKPEPESMVLDVSAVIEAGSSSESVYAAGASLRGVQILVGPNIFFESSRSSLDEPKTIGPEGAAPPAPELSNALGKAVPTEASSRLLRYLSTKGVTVIVPAIARRWLANMDEADRASSAHGTWLERLLVTGDGAVGNRLTPTTALAVRELGLSVQRMSVVIEERDGRLHARPRQSALDPSMCDEIVLPMPVIAFAAEIVAAGDGHLIARIFERRTRSLESSLRSIITTRWRPVRATSYTRYELLPRTRKRVAKPESRYQYVERWEPAGELCANVRAELEEISQLILVELSANATVTLNSILSESLSRLL